MRQKESSYRKKEISLLSKDSYLSFMSYFKCHFLSEDFLLPPRLDQSLYYMLSSYPQPLRLITVIVK